MIAKEFGKHFHNAQITRPVRERICQITLLVRSRAKSRDIFPVSTILCLLPSDMTTNRGRHQLFSEFGKISLVTVVYQSQPGSAGNVTIPGT